MIADSTIAMSAVSVLSVHGATTRAQLEQGIALFYGLAVEQLAPGIDEAIARGLIIVEGETHRSILPPGYAVKYRSTDGDGWGNWIAQNLAGQTIDVGTLLNGGA